MAAYRQVDDLVTCGLTACIPRSAQGSVLGNEYGKLFIIINTNDDVNCCCW